VPTRRTPSTLLLLAVLIATGAALLATGQMVVGLDQVARSVLSIASTVRLPR